MPRKKTLDPIDQILSFAETAEAATILIVIGLLNREIKRRLPPEPTKVVVRRRRKPAPMPPAPMLEKLVAQTAAHVPVEAPKRRRRRMRADSQPPVSEATPIVPLQAEVGEGDETTYTGN